ncbi:Calpain-2 catalytic subunit [Aquarana catesbeiana]|uniref:Calpain-2 catalytic subunit n=1 Tax=Aquarana catesbeiana TaxID=8400 RepID=A0A2G9SLM0_AQUCT|nr:Calpain-2 catalytic subunit [Aquarana catesbeiana]
MTMGIPNGFSHYKYSTVSLVKAGRNQTSNEKQTKWKKLQASRSKIDSDGSGKLGLKEFNILWSKLQKYQKIYRSIDVDRSGTMNTTEMRKALEAAGFKLNSQIHQLLVARFADENYSIDFDNFVRCLIRLEIMFKIFKQMDTENSGVVPLSFDSWMSFTVM